MNYHKLDRNNVERHAAVGDGRGLPEEQVAALKRHRWDRNFHR